MVRFDVHHCAMMGDGTGGGLSFLCVAPPSQQNRPSHRYKWDTAPTDRFQGIVSLSIRDHSHPSTMRTGVTPVLLGFIGYPRQ